MGLLQSFNQFQSKHRYVDLMEHVKDRTGQMYALRIRNKQRGTEAYFCFKNSMKGKTVSIHKELIDKAKPKNRPIIMGVEERFYLFMPADIERDCRENTRNGHIMVNFPITAGRSLQEPEAKKPEPQATSLFDHPIAPVMQRELGELEKVS